MNINIQQSTGITEQVANNVIGKIYDISKNNAITSNFIGNLTVDATYQDYIDTLQAKYPELYITARKLYIKFEDPEVERILKEKGCSSDGIGITMEDASRFTIGQDTFKGNTTITSFNEFKYFDYVNQVLAPKTMFENSSLTSIDMSNFIMSVSLFMFKGSALTSINLPLATGINIEGFRNCSNLTEATLSIGTSLGQNAFRDCTELTTVNIPNVTSIGPSCFDGDAKITTLDIDWTKITYIGNNAFYNSNIPGSIVLSSYNESLGNWAFYNCSGITTFSAPLISTLPINCLSYSAVTSADLPATTEIKEEAFRNCSSLTTVNIPNVTVLESNVFNECINLQTVTIDWSKIKVIGRSIFSGCTNLGNGETVDLNLTEQTSYPTLAFQNTKYKKLIIHMQLEAYNGIIGNYDTRYPIHAGMVQLEYLDYSDSNIINWAPLYLSDDANGHMNTMIWPATITHVDWRWHMYMPNLQYFIILVEDPSQMDITGSGANFLKGGEAGRIPLTCNVYVKDSTVRDAYLAHEFWGTIPNASTRIKTLAELPVGVWKTGLYKQYEPYLSHSDDPAYAE